jgi:hypothetical protein
MVGVVTAGAANVGASTTEHLIVTAVSGILYVAALTPLALRLPGTIPTRLAGIFVPLYVTGTLANLIEAYFFTMLLTPAGLGAALAFEAIPAVAVALIVAVLVPGPPPTTRRPSAASRRRPLHSWAWRLLVVALLYVPTYYAFTALVAPIEHPFYSDPAFVAQLHTRAQPNSVMAPLEAVRGALFALALVPVLAVVPGRRWWSLAYLALIGAAIEAVVPLLGLTGWPVAMRLGNVAELTGDAAGRAAAAMAFLAFPPMVRRDNWRGVRRWVR